nr:immunoglobulin heavy chain junction region [Mus musculus]
VQDRTVVATLWTTG